MKTSKKRKVRIKRDSLDYIITDTLPIEISEIFTYTYFYNYLHNNSTGLKDIFNIEKELKNNFKKTQVPFRGNWSSTPLTYNILKPNRTSFRKISIPTPIAAINLYLFIKLYEKEILCYLSSPCFSARYQRKNLNLFFTSKQSNSLINYKYKHSKRVIEQNGNYFNIGPVERGKELKKTRQWEIAELSFKYFCKLDYKRCFDSIYTHAYKWIKVTNIIDSKNMNNSNLFIAIDRTLQNINGRSSNGILVGPEFSRMVAEILLQTIDTEVEIRLKENGIIKNKDYQIMRFVDDVFIFSNDEKHQEFIIESFRYVAQKYLLEINDLKTEKYKIYLSLI